MQQKTKEILRALAQGDTCEEILANDGTVTHHELFHTLSETPTSHWKKIVHRRPAKPWTERTEELRTPPRHRVD
jgi:hypothetical protein